MNYSATVKNTVKATASPVLDLCGIYDSMLSRRLFSQSSWVVLMYHRIIDTPRSDPFQLGMCVQQSRFEEQIKYHLEHFTPITVAEAAARLRNGKPLPRNAFSVTFDDGYRDFRDLALPVLEKYHCPATLYVTTGGLEERKPFWFDEVVNAFALTERRQIDIGFLEPELPKRVLSLSSFQRARSLSIVKNLLWRKPASILEELVARLREELGVFDDEYLAAPRLSVTDIERVARKDVEIAAHCEAHVDMTLLSPERVTHELEASRSFLRDISAQPVNGFAYPGGRENELVRQLVARAGFSYAAGTVRGVNRLPYHTLSLRRIGMPNTSISDYKRCLAAAAGEEPEPMARETVLRP